MAGAADRLRAVARLVELGAGVALGYFAVSTVIGFMIMKFLLDRPDWLPAGDLRQLLVPFLHDLGYVLLAPAAGWVVSGFTPRPRVAAASMVAAAYLFELLLVSMIGSPSPLWAWPLGFWGRAVAVAMAAAGAVLAAGWAEGRRKS